MSRKPRLLRGVFPGALAESVGVYVSSLRKRREMLVWDAECARYYRHDDPIARLLHERLVPLVGQVLGVDVRPSYSFVALYQGGSVLPPHRDREQCKYNLGLCINATRVWPFFVDGERIRLQPGDSVLYSGQDLHWRKPLAKGHQVDMMLFHFVDAEFAGALR